jgi:hypothetical protein
MPSSYLTKKLVMPNIFYPFWFVTFFLVAYGPFVGAFANYSHFLANPGRPNHLPNNSQPTIWHGSRRHELNMPLETQT